MQPFFGTDDPEPGADENTEKTDWPYWMWFVAAVGASFLAAWNRSHYELLAKIAWTMIGPGFTFSQTWGERKDSVAYISFTAFLAIHLWLMETIFPKLPIGRFGYILVLGIAEIMTLGLAFQVWLRLRSKHNGAGE